MAQKIRPPRKKKQKLNMMDTAFKVLHQYGKPLSLKELVEKTSEAMGKEFEGKLSHYHTEFNMDRRFVYMGSNQWALREWTPRQKEVLMGVNISEADYEPDIEDYRWDQDVEEDSDSLDDESELLVPFEEDEEEVIADANIDLEIKDEDLDEDEEDDDEEEDIFEPRARSNNFTRS